MARRLLRTPRSAAFLWGALFGPVALYYRVISRGGTRARMERSARPAWLVRQAPGFRAHAAWPIDVADFVCLRSRPLAYFRAPIPLPPCPLHPIPPGLPASRWW